MAEDFIALGKAFLSGAWSMFSVPFPGLGISIGELLLGTAIAGISVLVLKLIFGFGAGPGGDSPRTSSTLHPRISKDRRRDEF